MSKTIDLIIPNVIEMHLTGKFGAVKNTHRGREFLVEFWRHGTLCFKDGKSVDWLKLPHAIRKEAHEGFEIIKQSYKMRRDNASA